MFNEDENYRGVRDYFHYPGKYRELSVVSVM